MKRTLFFVTAVVVLTMATQLRSPIKALAHGTIPFGTPNVIHACKASTLGVLRQIDSGNCLSTEEVVHCHRLPLQRGR